MSTHFDRKRESWTFVIDLPPGDDGKRRQMWRRGFKTQPEAQKAEKIAKQQFGKADLAADGTVAAEVSGWLEERELDVAVTTLGNYRNAINRYVIPYLGGRQLYTLDKRAINDLYRHLLAKGGRGETPLAAETVRHVHRVLMKVFKDIGIHIEGVRQPRKADRETAGRKGVWTAAQCSAFLAYAAEDRLYAAWVLAIVCGMRRGELAGLKWSRVDLDVGVVHVHWQRAVASGVVAGGVIEKESKGKSKRSPRDRLSDHFRAYRSSYGAEQRGRCRDHAQAWLPKLMSLASAPSSYGCSHLPFVMRVRGCSSSP